MWSNSIYGRERRGMTLVEVLVALTVLSVGILGLLGALLLGSNISARSEHLDAAVALANTKLEEALCTTADKLEAQQGQEDRFTYALAIENRSGGLMAAKMTVQWLEAGNVQEYTLSKVFQPIPKDEQQGK